VIGVYRKGGVTMAVKRRRQKSRPVKDLLFPIYLVLDKGGPGLRLRLRDGRWRIDRLDSRVTSTILRAAECGRGAGGVCVGTCPAGRTCQTVMTLEVEFFEVPEGIPQPPSGRSGFVVKRVGKVCKCLASTG
jgi:hypothetical protein